MCELQVQKWIIHLKRELSLSHLDPHTKESELEVQRIIHLQKLANQLPYAFTDTKRVTKSHILVVNAPIRIDIPIRQSNIANESQTRLKRGRLVSSKDKNPRVRKREKRQDGLIEGVKVPKDSFDIINDSVPEEPQVPEIVENDEISINYVMNHKIWNRNKVNIDEVFAYNDQEPMTNEDCRQRNDWPKWKDAIQAELDSLAKRKVFGPVVRTLEGVKSIGYRWVFV